MKLLEFLVIILLPIGDSHAQEFSHYTGENSLQAQQFEGCYIPQKPKEFGLQRLYLEIGGSGGFGSINYELSFLRKNRFRLMFRAGLSATYIDKNNGAAFIFPVMIHGVFGEKHCLDLGLGQALSITTRGNVFLRTPLSLGYRLEPDQTRFYYRFSYTPILSNIVDFQWEHWGGISIGYKLK